VNRTIVQNGTLTTAGNEKGILARNVLRDVNEVSVNERMRDGK
jgi:hypothetical protein